MRLMKRLATALVAAQCLAAFSALAAAPDCPGPSQTPWPTKDWEASTSEAEGMDSAALAQLVDLIGAYKQEAFWSSAMARSSSTPITRLTLRTSGTI